MLTSQCPAMNQDEQMLTNHKQASPQLVNVQHKVAVIDPRKAGRAHIVNIEKDNTNKLDLKTSHRPCLSTDTNRYSECNTLKSSQTKAFAPKYRQTPMMSVTSAKVKGVVKTKESMPCKQQQNTENLEINNAKKEITAKMSALPQQYTSAKVDLSASEFRTIGIASSAIENDRQLTHLCKSTSRPSDECRLGLLDSLSNMLGFATHGRTHTEDVTETEQKRQLKVRLSMEDPLLDEVHRCAHKLFVSGCSISELRTAGVQAMHLCEIGVTYADWSQKCNLGVRDLVFLNASWSQVIAMGFLPKHITMDRDKSGPVILSQPPLSVTMNTLEQTLGLTIDEAVFELSFSTADFGVLGEDMTSLMHKGFNRTHVKHMSEPPYNLQEALGATASDLHFLFSCEQADTESQTNKSIQICIEQQAREKSNVRSKTSSVLSDRAYLENKSRTTGQTTNSNQNAKEKAFCFS